MEDAFGEQAVTHNVRSVGNADFLSLLAGPDEGDNLQRTRNSAEGERDPLIQPAAEERPAEPVIDDAVIEQRTRLLVARSGMKWCLSAYVVLVLLLAVVIFFEVGFWGVIMLIALGGAGLLLLATMVLALYTKKKLAVVAVLVVASLTFLVVLAACVSNVFVLIRSSRALVWSVKEGLGEVYSVYQDTTGNITSGIGGIHESLQNLPNGGAISGLIGSLPSLSESPEAREALSNVSERLPEGPALNADFLRRVPTGFPARLRQHASEEVELSASEISESQVDAPNLFSGIDTGIPGVPSLKIGLQIKPSANDWLTVPGLELPSFPEIKNTCHEDYADPTSAYRKGVNIASQSMARFGLFCSFTHLNFFELQQWPVSCTDECGFDQDTDKFIGSASKDNRLEAVTQAYEKRGLNATDPLETVKMCTALQTATSCSIWNMWYFLVLPVISALWLLLCVCSCCVFIPGIYNGSKVLRKTSA
ncbi:hypothetical protein BESB_060750 [Besnoitia besnoiti]|uniref:Transmembrane protein n=1 Tax=Besnoitia besnoiti TaxID=94643 RepID=A0A2A9M9M7_BESBE|nr:hypothetical protein BESB_060750 [Besnoitia besnoiti]PFH35188.1 hypothetical protein BESB_060750 [Besnoitia besnoiti]